MKRLHIKHSRDSATKPGWRWDLYLTDTQDRKADPIYLAYGSHANVLAFADQLVQLNRISPVQIYCFEQASK